MNIIFNNVCVQAGKKEVIGFMDIFIFIHFWLWVKEEVCLGWWMIVMWIRINLLAHSLMNYLVNLVSHGWFLLLFKYGWWTYIWKCQLWFVIKYFQKLLSFADFLFIKSDFIHFNFQILMINGRNITKVSRNSFRFTTIFHQLTNNLNYSALHNRKQEFNYKIQSMSNKLS